LRQFRHRLLVAQRVRHLLQQLGLGEQVVMYSLLGRGAVAEQPHARDTEHDDERNRCAAQRAYQGGLPLFVHRLQKPIARPAESGAMRTLYRLPAAIRENLASVWLPPTWRSAPRPADRRWRNVVPPSPAVPSARC